jgi:MOSC domain-containing protein YiiM
VTIPVNIAYIYSSPEHHYFTRKKFDVGAAETIEHESVFLEPNRGIENDRFENSKFPLTFVSEEVMQEVCQELDLAYKPALFRRNVVTSGINLNQLIGKSFYIGNVQFLGLEHCAPCTWMNAVMKKGAYALMSGRGGLRVKVIQEGCLKRGANILQTEDNFELLNPLEALKKPRIP